MLSSPKVLINSTFSSKHPPLALLRVVLLLLVLDIAFVNVWAGIGSLFKPAIYMKDFFQDYAMSWAALKGIDPYTPVPELKRIILNISNDRTNPHPTSHPPPVIPLFIALTLLPYEQAAVLWFILELSASAVALIFLYKHHIPSAGWFKTLLVALLTMAWSPFREEFILGQQMSVILLLLVGAWLALKARKDIKGGIYLGIIISLKLIAWPIVVLLVFRKRLRAFFSAVATIVALNLVAASFIGFGHAISYYAALGPTVSSLYRAVDRNRSLWTVGWRLFYGTGRDYVSNIQAPPLLDAPGVASVLSFVVPSAVLLVVLWISLRLVEFDVSFSLLILVSLVISPITWDFYFLLILLPVATTLQILWSMDLPNRSTCFAGGVILLFLVYDRILILMFRYYESRTHGIGVPLCASLLTLLPTLGILLLIWLMWHLAKRSLRIAAADLSATPAR